MTRPTDDQLLAFLERTLSDEERARIQEQLDADPELAAAVERAARGLTALRALPSAQPASPGRQISPWWLLAAAALAVAVAVPATLHFAPPASSPTVADTRDGPATPEFVLVLRGRWSDDIQLEPEEFERRLGELQEWTHDLASQGVLINASDLALEQGVRFGSPEAPVPGQVPETDYIVGVLTLRMDAYHDALAVARSSPHLRYGGTVTVRRAGAGFFTVRGKPDFSG